MFSNWRRPRYYKYVNIDDSYAKYGLDKIKIYSKFPDAKKFRKN